MQIFTTQTDTISYSNKDSLLQISAFICPRLHRRLLGPSFLASPSVHSTRCNERLSSPGRNNPCAHCPRHPHSPHTHHLHLQMVMMKLLEGRLCVDCLERVVPPHWHWLPKVHRRTDSFPTSAHEHWDCGDCDDAEPTCCCADRLGWT
jgi:hypothetical protein